MAKYVLWKLPKNNMFVLLTIRQYATAVSVVFLKIMKIELGGLLKAVLPIAKNVKTRITRLPNRTIPNDVNKAAHSAANSLASLSDDGSTSAESEPDLGTHKRKATQRKMERITY